MKHFEIVMVKFRKCRGPFMTCILLLLIIILCLQSKAYAQARQLDSSFADNGIKIKNFDFNPLDVPNDYLSEIALQADGKIVAAGSASLIYAVMRFKTDGTMDSTFGTNGKIQRIPGSGNSYINTVAIQPDQKILIGGYIAVGIGPHFNENFGLMRLNPNGDNDSTFGVNGLLNSDMGDSTEMLRSIALQPDGKIVAVGSVGPYSNFAQNDIAIARYLNNGSLDISFGNGGIVLNDIAFEDHAQKVLIQADGKIVIAGISVNDTLFETKTFILRYLSNGQIDNTFGIQGMFSHRSNAFGCADMALQPDGKIVAVVTLLDANFNHENSILRLNTDGTLDNTFGMGGMAKNTTCIEYGSGAISLQPDGKILVAGQSIEDTALGTTNFYLMRYTPQGFIDNSFGVNGVSELNITTNEGFSDVLIQPDGKIVAGGYTEIPATSEDFVVMRFKNDLVSTVEDYTKDFRSKLYPNPTHGKFTIDYLKPLEGEINVKVFDISGKTILSKSEIKGAYKTNLNLEVGAGIYLLQIIESTGEIVFTQSIHIE